MKGRLRLLGIVDLSCSICKVLDWIGSLLADFVRLRCRYFVVDINRGPLPRLELVLKFRWRYFLKRESPIWM